MNNPLPLARLCRGTPIKPLSGLWPNYSRQVYDSLAAVSSSVLKQWMRDESVPSRFEYWLNNRWSLAQSNALILGDALDCKVLTPKAFPFRFCTVPPGAPKRPSKIQIQAKNPSPETLQAIGFWNDFNAKNEGKTILTTEQITTVNEMEKAALQAEATQGIFEHCSKMVLVGELWGYPAKAEIDLWSDASEHILDLKTAADASPFGFGAAAAKYGYLEQAVWYLRLARALGFDKHQFSWVVVESEPPYAVQVYTLDPDIPKHAEAYLLTSTRMMDAFSRLIKALEKDSFKDTADWHPLEIPAWVLSRRENE